MAQFPVDSLIPELRRTLAATPNAVLQAAPGAGKTTRVPLALLDADWLAGRKIIMLEPRRLAARAVARFMARALGEPVGRRVGYRMRLDTKVSADTRIEVVTEGILSRLLQDDPALETVGLVIFDEFHERSLHADLALALCLDVQSALRDDLRILVMSATLAETAVATLLGDCPVLSCEGRNFPVDIRYQPLDADHARQRQAFCKQVARCIERLLQTESGSLLVFLPGVGEIRQVLSVLQAATLAADVRLAPLHGQLDAEAQDLAIAPAQAGQRKVVLATSVAETSLTIEGIRVVVDAGLMRHAEFDPNSGLDRLRTRCVSRAAADQRCGRAGRLEAGVCYRLWSEHRHLVPHSSAEILQADLAAVMLQLAQWGVRDATQLRWLDTPPAAHRAQARDLLLQLGAIDTQGAITAHGRMLSGLGVHPRLAHMMIEGTRLGYAGLACELAALLSERDPLRGADSDIQRRVEWLRGNDAGKAVAGARQRLRAMAAAWLKHLDTHSDAAAQDDLSLCGVLLAFAYPDRVARRRDGRANRFVLANGRGACFSDEEPLAASEYIVAADLDGEREARIFLAAALDVDDLRHYLGELIRSRETVAWLADEGCVAAHVQDRLGALVIDERRLDSPDPDAVEQAMLDGIRSEGIGCLPWNEDSLQLQARIGFLRRLDADRWPDFSDAQLMGSLDEWLRPYLSGISRLAQLKRLDMRTMLLAQLGWERQQQLDQLAPTHIRVPSGSRIRLDYSQSPPVLAVRLQEMFGLAETPSVAAGSVPVLLHLLSPARRPVQVTADLAGFWSGSYHQVKKDLKGRYPKHYWPEDPLTAQATSRTRPR